jgi:histidinol-phosphate aminotransferase
VGSPGIIRGLVKIKDSYNVDILAMAGAVAALKDRKALSYNMEMVVNNKEYLEEGLRALGFEIIPSRANFLMTRHPALGAWELYEALKERKILVRHYTGPVQSDYIRVSVGTMMEIKTLLKELAAITAGG